MPVQIQAGVGHHEAADGGERHGKREVRQAYDAQARDSRLSSTMFHTGRARRGREVWSYDIDCV